VAPIEIVIVAALVHHTVERRVGRSWTVPARRCCSPGRLIGPGPGHRDGHVGTTTGNDGGNCRRSAKTGRARLTVALAIAGASP
jgi:hypothetical protein